MLNLQDHMDRKKLKSATLQSYIHLSMQRLREEHYEALDVTKDNSTTETIEELDNLSQNLEEKMWFLQLILMVILYMYHHMYQV